MRARRIRKALSHFDSKITPRCRSFTVYLVEVVYVLSGVGVGIIFQELDEALFRSVARMAVNLFDERHDLVNLPVNIFRGDEDHFAVGMGDFVAVVNHLFILSDF